MSQHPGTDRTGELIRAQPDREGAPSPHAPTLVHGHAEPRPPERVVVLGGDGFVGRALRRQLAAQNIDTLSPNSRDLDLASPSADRALAERIRPGDALVLLAAVKPGRRHDERAFQASVGMASALCRAIRASGCAHLVYVSSDAVYPFVDTPVDEHLATSPTSPYARMHLTREAMVQAIDDVPVAILRLTQVHGAGDPHNAYGPSRMIRSALGEGRIVLYGSGEESRDHVHIDEVAAALVAVLTRQSHGLLNVATGRSISFAQLAGLVQRMCGGTAKIEHAPRRMPIMHRCFDISQLDAAFPHRLSVPLEDGLAFMLDEEASRADARGRRGESATGGSAPTSDRSKPPLSTSARKRSS